MPDRPHLTAAAADPTGSAAPASPDPDRYDAPEHPGNPGHPADPDTPWWARHTRAPRLHPHQVQTRTLRGTLGGLLLATALTLSLIRVLIGTEVADVETVPGGGLAYRQTTNALIGGCGPAYTFTDITAESGVIPTTADDGKPNRAQYRTIVPLFGHFWDTPAPTTTRFYPRGGDTPTPETLLHNAWNGDLVVYYTKDTDPTDITALRTLAANEGDRLRLIVAPWPEERGPLPGNRKIAFVTWNYSQTCHRLVAPALQDFRDARPVASSPGARGIRPPQAPTTTATATADVHQP